MLGMLLEATARSLALGLLVWLTLTLTRSRNVHLQKMLWTTVLLVSLAMPFLMRAHIPVALPLVIQGSFVHGAAPHVSPTFHGAVGALYLLVASALLAHFARNLLKMSRIRRNAQVLKDYDALRHSASNTAASEYDITADCRADGAHADIRVSDKLFTPATFGSTILLPTEFRGWSAQTLQAVLAHEQSHVRHRDSYMLWLARFYTCLFWTNPLGWLIQRRLAALSETISDEAAVLAVGDRPSYAEILLQFASRRATGSSAAVAMARSNIPSRIDRILSNIAPSTPPKLPLRILALVALLPAVAATAASVDAAPPVVKFFDLKQLEKYYPQSALHRGIEGMVQVQVSLDSDGHATDTLILSEQPQELGFGAAASTLAHLLEYDNPSHRPAQLTFNVKFALPPRPEPSGTTQLTAPEEP